jgi:hypothetical protein
MTSCYEFYYDVWGNGLYLLQIKEMHEVYGKLKFLYLRGISSGGLILWTLP